MPAGERSTTLSLHRAKVRYRAAALPIIENQPMRWLYLWRFVVDVCRVYQAYRLFRDHWDD